MSINARTTAYRKVNLMFKPTDTFAVRLHKRTDRYFLFFTNAEGQPTDLATSARFWSDMDAIQYVADRDGNTESISYLDCNLPVPAGFKLPKKK